MRQPLLVCLLAIAAACTNSRSAPDSTAAKSTVGGDPYAGFAYDSLVRAPQEAFVGLPGVLRSCTSKALDTLTYGILRLEVKGDSLRGFVQDSTEGNADAPHFFRKVRYDSVARLLSFTVATAPRTLLEYQLSASCDSLVGVELIRTAYLPQDGTQWSVGPRTSSPESSVAHETRASLIAIQDA